jgi:hypothetical protein
MHKFLLKNTRKKLEKKHWMEMIENPRRPIIHWHVLKVISSSGTISGSIIKCIIRVAIVLRHVWYGMVNFQNWRLLFSRYPTAYNESNMYIVVLLHGH